MKLFLTIVIVAMLMVIAGWITWSTNDNQTTIQFDKQEAKQDTEKLIQEGDQAINRTEKRLEELDDRADNDLNDNGIPDANETQPIPSERPNGPVLPPPEL